VQKEKSMKRNTKGKLMPAFPFVAKDDTGMIINSGIDVRAYFAAHAMAGLLAGMHSISLNEVPECAFALADEMIKEAGII
jgi:hypothetical protein